MDPESPETPARRKVAPNGAPESRAGDRGLRWWVLAATLGVGAFAGAVAGFRVAELTRKADPVAVHVESADVNRTAGDLVTPEPARRSIAAFEGYGTWIDVFDYSPLYGDPVPSVKASDVAEMASFGVKTLYMQAARLDSKSPLGLVDPWLLAEFLLAAHREGIRVVAWYLPKWSEDDSDLQRVRMLNDFEVLGNRFDGVALDIESTSGVDVGTRNSRLVALSKASRSAVGPDPLAAIVLPPVLIEVVNTDYWPEFPWTEIAGSYDVWMPMSYWSFRSDQSGYGDGYAYNEESTRRLRDDLGDPNAIVHGIGGIGGVDGVNDSPKPEEPLTKLAELDAFVKSLVDTGSVGGSIYDWATLEPEARERLARLFGEGPGSQLPTLS